MQHNNILSDNVMNAERAVNNSLSHFEYSLRELTAKVNDSQEKYNVVKKRVEFFMISGIVFTAAYLISRKIRKSKWIKN